jgi:hypothetical protein
MSLEFEKNLPKYLKFFYVLLEEFIFLKTQKKNIQNVKVILIIVKILLKDKKII